MPITSLEKLIASALEEDLGYGPTSGDHSSLCCIPPDKSGRAELRIKEAGVLAGVEVARKVFAMASPDAGFDQLMADGDRMEAGHIAFRVSAPAIDILKCERLVLNCMQRMSGIATLTSKYVSVLRGYKTRILDTRKTTPNFRLLEKEAVRIGGGVNHRFGLFDMIMLKDNHIDFCGGIVPAISRAWDYVSSSHPGLLIEIETRSLDDVKQVIDHGNGKVFRIMLDNFTPADVARAVELIDGRFETEASGGITLENLTDYALAGVDYISSGALIHQAQSLDLSLKAIID